jgi:hypothetical protein
MTRVHDQMAEVRKNAEEAADTHWVWLAKIMQKQTT